MTKQLSKIRWWRLMLTALTVHGASFLLVFLTITAYASYLAFQVRSAPDQGLIVSFASQYAPWLGSMSLILFTFLGAGWLASFVRTDIELHGLILGLFVAFVNSIFERGNAFSPGSLLTTVLVIGAGWVGGILAERM